MRRALGAIWKTRNPSSPPPRAGAPPATLDEARSRGYSKAQLWTHKGNERAKRLYEKHGFERSGRAMKDDVGAWAFHYERGLWVREALRFVRSGKDVLAVPRSVE